jgi:hypothetical protein
VVDGGVVMSRDKQRADERQPLRWTIDRVDDVAYIRLCGDAVWAYALLHLFRSMVEDHQDFVVDVSGLRRIDDVGLDDLRQAVRWGKDFDVEVSFIPGSAELQRTIEGLLPSIFRWIEPPENERGELPRA